MSEPTEVQESELARLRTGILRIATDATYRAAGFLDYGVDIRPTKAAGSLLDLREELYDLLRGSS